MRKNTQVCQECQICLRFHQILEVILETFFFGILHTDLKVELNFYDHNLPICMKMHLMLRPGREMHDGSPLSSPVREYQDSGFRIFINCFKATGPYKRVHKQQNLHTKASLTDIFIAHKHNMAQ